MKTEDPIIRILRSWEVHSEVPQDFRRNVWARIQLREADQVGDWFSFIDWLFPTNAQAQLAAVIASIMIVVGAGFGVLSAKFSNDQERAEMQVRYAQSVDPYLQVASYSSR